MDFLDGSYAFTTIAGQDNYTAGHPNFPADVYGWNGQPYVVNAGTPASTRRVIVGPVPISEIRRQSLVLSTVGTLYPDKFAWYLKSMWFYPIPSGIITIRGDYRRDGTKDAATGAEITTASTTHTNGWFVEGENALRCAVIYEWLMSIAKDFNAAQGYKAQLEDAKSALATSRAAKTVGSVQVGDSMWGSDEVVDDEMALYRVI